MMVTYIFYPRLPDGSTPVFISKDLVDDAEALARAHKVLEEHASAVDVAIWRDDCLVAM